MEFKRYYLIKNIKSLVKKLTIYKIKCLIDEKESFHNEFNGSCDLIYTLLYEFEIDDDLKQKYIVVKYNCLKDLIERIFKCSLSEYLDESDINEIYKIKE